MKKPLLFLIITFFWNTTYAENCTSRGTSNNRPQARDELILRTLSGYSNDEYTGTNYRAVFDVRSREITCSLITPRPHAKCFSRIELFGTAPEGSDFQIPGGAVAHISSRPSSPDNTIHIRFQRTEGMVAPSWRVLKMNCSRYSEIHEPEKAPRDREFYGGKFPCFNDDISLLFENTTLASCRASAPAATTPASASSAAQSTEADGGSQSSGIQ